jgi:quercetin 2,3-dioxygenase
MITLRPAAQRGFADHGWLKSYHSFSFADYRDPEHTQFGALRVLNDDRVAAGGGFDTHGHRDMEILTWPLQGALEHHDSLGNGTVIRTGDLQRMAAGTGVEHSEYNHSQTEPVHFLQIWILPRRRGIAPAYTQIHCPENERRGRLRLIAAPEAHEGAVTIDQDVTLYAGLFDGGEQADFKIAKDRKLYLHVARGTITAGGHNLQAGDALKTEQEPQLSLQNGVNAEVLLFDLA